MEENKTNIPETEDEVLTENADTESTVNEAAECETEEKVCKGEKKKLKKAEAEIAELKKALEAKEAEAAELNDKYMRLFAEFDNFRKRTEKEKAAMFEVGAKNIIEKILPIVDNFERGLATLTEEEKAQPFADGMDKVYKQLMKALEEAGVTPIEAVGKEFDPNLHNAVMHGEDENLGENIIAEEYQKGYMYRESVVRYSMVKVMN